VAIATVHAGGSGPRGEESMNLPSATAITPSRLPAETLPPSCHYHTTSTDGWGTMTYYVSSDDGLLCVLCYCAGDRLFVLYIYSYEQNGYHHRVPRGLFTLKA
jgi:hypothetical protein